MDAKDRKRAFKRLRSRLSSAKSWTTTAGGAVAGSAFFVPYMGLGAPDGVWVTVAGFSTAMAVVRWLDYRRLARALPAVERDSLEILGPARLSKEARGLFGETAEAIRRGRIKAQFRRSRALRPYERLERASIAAEQMAQRLEGNAEAVAILAGAAKAGHELYRLALGVRDVEQAIAIAPEAKRAGMEANLSRMVERLEHGVAAYEDMVSAAGECLAGSIGLQQALSAHGGDETLDLLTDAADRLRAAGDAASEIRGSVGPQATA
ncbi:hypothetical protein K3N28_04170 [Glycomyces sp. TRM65418]|uniref:phage shock envelope stress response protein PspM n=1 Tax=Glycomyces sp. TRM65418 TaxID=2867006 RepID=UPI001CE57BBA|nr:hypothetical protein [Glycomyces sp. TRM65418]MCC3762267.1 hypothetical protein [Glycomyces sp. TRM65418]QZD56323.1 hypothetical protein K3N28_04140 [Glycomyces sp. TRM65418]